MSHLSRDVRRIAASPHLLRACINHSELPPFCPDFCISNADVNKWMTFNCIYTMGEGRAKRLIVVGNPNP